MFKVTSARNWSQNSEACCPRNFILNEAIKDGLIHFFCFSGSLNLSLLLLLLLLVLFSKRRMQFKDDVSWPRTRCLYSQHSLTFTLPLPFSTFTCPCACSVYCNRIQHAALQATDKPAPGQLPTPATVINRLFTQAYQSLYPPRMCVWELADIVQRAQK